MRRTSTLLKIVKEIRDKNEMPSVGLCSWVNHCCNEDHITEEEKIKLHNILQINKPKKVNDVYWFPPNGVARTRFLNKLIKKYSESK